jgi:death-on-curing protein
MINEPVWVLNDVVIAIHRRQISEHGGLDGIRDSGLLESALGNPQNLYHYGEPKPSIAQMAASYAYGIARNHPFLDGNKRTAFVVCELFLGLNGLKLKAGMLEKYNTFISLADGTISEAKLVEWIIKNI